MCERCDMREASEIQKRRRFLTASAAMAAMSFAGAGAFSGAAYADAVTKAKRDKLTPDDVLSLMKKGNTRFKNLETVFGFVCGNHGGR